VTGMDLCRSISIFAVAGVDASIKSIEILERDGLLVLGEKFDGGFKKTHKFLRFKQKGILERKYEVSRS
jgi:hypothetical protein